MLSIDNETVIFNDVIQYNGTLFCIKIAENGNKENQKNAHPLRTRFQKGGTTNVICRITEF